MKKSLFILIAAAVLNFTSCKGGITIPRQDNTEVFVKKSVQLKVSTTYGGDDGGRIPYENAVASWSERTGCTVLDMSGTSNEEFKKRIATDFEAGAEPDVLFYFNGADSNTIIKSGKVVSIEEIRREYPYYASEHAIEKIPVSPADNVAYAIPAYGYWELMYANRAVLNTSGVLLPNEHTTWDEFIKICEKIKEKGFIPIAVSLYEVPHYWFEFTAMNYSGTVKHSILPESAEDETAQSWIKGLKDIKDFYERGFFPSETLTMSDADAWNMIYEGKAAFVIDGSWKIGNIETDAANLNDITTCFVPAKENRKPTDIIGGLSSGWYITRKAWNDPEKQSAAVDFVNFMSSKWVVRTFDAAGAPVSFKTGSIEPVNPSPLRQASIITLSKSTGSAPAIQDSLDPNKRTALFSGIKSIVTGEVSVEEAVYKALKN